MTHPLVSQLDGTGAGLVRIAGVIQAVGQGCGVTEVSPRDTLLVTDGYRDEWILRAVGPCYPLSKSHLSRFSPFFLRV